MILELVIAICAAFAGAGFLLLGARLLGVKLPKAAIPVAAAVSIVALTIWMRYSWADRAVAGLPEGAVVIGTIPYTGFLEPWTVLFPRTGGLLVLDTKSIMRNPAHPRLAMVSIALVEHNADTIGMQQVVDCGRKRRAVVTADMRFDAEGLPLPEAWIVDGEPRALYDAVCQAETSAAQ